MARSVEDRIRWFRGHRQGWPGPARAGLCARHTWLSLGVPPIGAPSANSAYAKTKAAGHIHTDRRPPRGAVVFWTSAHYGHAALSLGGGRILSTDVKGPRTIGEVDLGWVETHWHGQRYRGWAFAWGSRKIGRS